jgi:hypothetical protein
MKKLKTVEDSSLGLVGQDARGEGRGGDVDVPFVPRPDVLAILLAENVNDHMSLGFFADLICTWGGVPAASLREPCIEAMETEAMETIRILWPAECGRENIREGASLANTQLGDEIAKAYVSEGKYPVGHRTRSR